MLTHRSLRDQLMEVRPMAQTHTAAPPLLYMERAAMIRFGVPSFGVHLNGFVRAPGGGPVAAVCMSVCLSVCLSIDLSIYISTYR